MTFEPFKKPDYSPGQPGKYELPKPKSKPEPVKKAEEKKNIFQKKAKEGGITRGEFRQELKKYDWAVHLDPKERLDIEKQMEWSKYSERISEKDVERRIKELKREKYNLPPDIKDKTRARQKIDQEIKLLDKKLKEKK